MTKKVQFTHNGTEYQAYTNGKVYGASKMVYLEVSKVDSSSRSKKGSYSNTREQFVEYGAGELDLLKAAAKALEIVE